MTVDPFLDGSKSSAPPVIFGKGDGTPDEAEVNITVTGAGDPLVHVFAQDVVFAIDSSGSMINYDSGPFSGREQIVSATRHIR